MKHRLSLLMLGGLTRVTAFGGGGVGTPGIGGLACGARAPCWPRLSAVGHPQSDVLRPGCRHTEARRWWRVFSFLVFFWTAVWMGTRSCVQIGCGGWLGDAVTAAAARWARG